MEHDASYKGPLMDVLLKTSHYLCRSRGKLRPEWTHLISQLIMETDSIYSAAHGEAEKDEGCDEKGSRDQERENSPRVVEGFNQSF